MLRQDVVTAANEVELEGPHTTTKSIRAPTAGKESMLCAAKSAKSMCTGASSLEVYLQSSTLLFDCTMAASVRC